MLKRWCKPELPAIELFLQQRLFKWYCESTRHYFWDHLRWISQLHLRTQHDNDSCIMHSGIRSGQPYLLLISGMQIRFSLSLWFDKHYHIERHDSILRGNTWLVRISLSPAAFWLSWIHADYHVTGNRWCWNYSEGLRNWNQRTPSAWKRQRVQSSSMAIHWEHQWKSAWLNESIN